MIALDTNILVYALDRQAGDRHGRALRLVTHCLDAGSLFLPTQVLAEFASVALRKLALDASTVAARVGDLRIAATIGAYDDTDVAAAIALADRAKLSFWDALAVTVCDRAGVPAFASEDLQNGLRCGRTKVVNPFLDANLKKLDL